MNVALTFDDYRLIVERAPIMIWRADLTMGCDYFNEVWLAFTGRTMGQETGNGWAEGVHAEDFDRCLNIYSEHFAARKSFEMEYRLRRHDGVYRWLFDRGVPCFDGDGVFRGYIGSCIDVTERVEAQNSQKAAHEKELDELVSILPICSGCKRIRNDKHYWEHVETYFSTHTNTRFSHGFCPDCLHRLYPDLAEDVLAPSKA